MDIYVEFELPMALMTRITIRMLPNCWFCYQDQTHTDRMIFKYVEGYFNFRNPIHIISGVDCILKMH